MLAETRGTHYALLASGEALIAGHLRPIGELACRLCRGRRAFLGTPYLWGGTSGFGIDCSGLVQLAMRMAGTRRAARFRHAGAALGEPIEPGADYSGLKRGDLVFWKGHVAIMTDAETMIHANGHTMLVSREGLHRSGRSHRLSVWRPDGIQKAVGSPFLLPVYGEKVPEGRMRGSANASKVRAGPHLPAGILSPCGPVA